MTCIVAIKDGNRIIMGGDSAAVGGLDIGIRKDRKVFKRGEFVFGFTESYRMGQLIQYGDPMPNLPADMPDADLHGWMCIDFIDWLRKTFDDKGWLEKRHEKEVGGFFLVGIRGHIYIIQDDFQVSERFDEYAACGCGENIALGSFHTTRSHKNAKSRAKAALEAAAYHSAGVSAPFILEATEVYQC